MFFIRSAGEADLDQVASLLHRSWHATYDAIYGAGKAGELAAAGHSVAALKAQLARPDSEFVVADDGRRIGGMAYAAMDGDEEDVVVLHQLHVDPDLTGQGIGRDLFAEVETCFPAAKRMRLDVEPKNEKALRFYRGLGFSEVGWTKNCGSAGSGIAAMILEKTLTF